MSKVIVFGTGGGADTATRYLEKDSDHEIVAYTVNREMKKQESFKGKPVLELETLADHFSPKEFKMFMLLNFNELNSFRTKKFEEAKKYGYSFISYVASDIFQVNPLSVGENCFILEKNTINLDVKIGNNVVIWSNNHIGDRTIIEDNVWIASQAAIGGDVTIGESCFIGMNSTISHSVKVGKRCFIGASTLIAKNTKDNAVYVVPETKGLSIDSEMFARMSNM